MSRPYSFRHERWLRAAAAVGVTALLAGCGGSGNSSQSGTPGSATPTPQSGTPTTAQSGTSKGTNAAVKPSVSQSGSGNGQSVAQAPAGASVLVPVPINSGSVGKLSNGASGKLTHGSISTSSSGAVGNVSHAAPGQASVGGTGSVSSGSTTPSSQPSAPSSTAPVKVIYKTRTITRTVVRTVPPQIPSGAFLPGLAVPPVQEFTIPSQNVVCLIGTTTDSSGKSVSFARCDIAQHRWTPPPKPSTCHENWSPGIAVIGTTRSAFVCSNKSILGSASTEIKPGYDDVFGSVRCEVRSFGVNCFVNHHHGFIISRTAYIRY